MGGISLWRSITGRVVLVVLAWLVPLVAIFAGASAVLYRDRIAAERDANLELARAAAHAFDGFVHDVLRQEQVMGEAIATRRLDPGVTELLLSRADDEYVSVRDFSFATPDGRIVASSAESARGRSIAGRDDFRRIEAGESFALTDVLSEGGSDRVVGIARAVRQDGALRGVVLATVDATRLGELAVAFERLGRADISIADHRGEVVFRRSGAGGGGAIDADAVARALKGEEVARAVRGGAITAAVPVPLVGWVAVASRSYADASAPFSAALAKAAALAAAAAALAVLVSVLVTRRIARALQRLERHVQALGRGDAVSTPLRGPGEVVRVGRAFDEMAGKLVAANASLVLHERLFETSPDPMVVLDRALRLRAVNPAYGAMVGSSPPDLLGRPLVDVAGLTAFEAMAPRIDRAFAGDSGLYEHWTDLPAGRRCVAASYHPVLDRDGIQHVGVRFRDVTDRRHAEAAAAQSLASVDAERRRFEAVFREVPAGIVIFDGRDLRAKWANRTSLSLLDAPFAQLGVEGLRIDEFVPSARASGLAEVIRRVGASGKPADLPEHLAEGFARGAVWWRVSVRPIPGETGTDVLLLVTEVTDEVQARKEAEDAVRRRDEVLAIVSHDLRTPLTAIVMGARVLGGSAAEHPERVRTTAARIATAGDRMNRLIDDLLDLASLERGRLSMQRAAHAPATLAREAADVIRPAAEAKGLEVHWRAPQDLPLVSCDHDRVLQVLGNLTSNAVKATGSGQVLIGASADGDAVVFEVRDTGPGIPPEELPHVFDRFRRGRSAAYAGTGLGLAIARALVEAHGGRISAESTPGAGTAVRFSLPVAAEAAPEHAAGVA